MKIIILVAILALVGIIVFLINKFFLKIDLIKKLKGNNKNLIILGALCVIFIALNIFLDRASSNDSATISEEEKQMIYNEMQIRYDEFTKNSCPVQIDENVSLSKVYFKDKYIFSEYDVVGLEIENIDTTLIVQNVLSSANEDHLKSYSSWGIGFKLKYNFGDTIKEVTITNSKLKELYENQIKAD